MLETFAFAVTIILAILYVRVLMADWVKREETEEEKLERKSQENLLRKLRPASRVPRH